MTTEDIKKLSVDDLLLKVKEEKDESLLISFIKRGGQKVSEENGDERVKSCHGCKYLGRTKGHIGCLECGCPFASKAYMKNLLNLKATCPHPQGSRWEEIDKMFK